MSQKDIEEILHRLELRSYFTGIEAVDEIVGLRLLATSALHHSIRFSMPGESEESKVAELSEFIFRYPPYEPIPLSIKGIKGRLVWLIEPKKFSPPYFFSLLKKTVGSLSEIVIKTSDEPSYIPDGIIVYHIEPIDILELKYPLLIIKVSDKYRYFMIKYGSRRLHGLVRARKPFEEIRRIYEEKTGRKYDPLNLSYVWYCRLGMGVSTDPWDVKCPFLRYCILSKKCGGRHWSRRRRIFPKMYIVRKANVRGTRKLMCSLSPLIDVYAIQEAEVIVRMHEAMTQLGDIISRPVNIEFSRPLAYVLPVTNAIAVKFKRNIIVSIIKNLLNLPINPKLKEYKKSPTVGDLLWTKMFLYEKGLQGRNVAEILGLSCKTFINRYLSFRKAATTKIIDFAYETLLHTLAHTIYEFLLSELEFNEKHLLYTYNVNDAEVIIAENTTNGSLNLIDYMIEIFQGNAETFLMRFLDFIRSVIDGHEKEQEEFSQKLQEDEANFVQITGLNTVLQSLKDYYSELINHGIVLDNVQFKIHVYESGYLELLSKRFKVSMEKIEDNLDHLILLVTKIPCIDGCASCVQLERYCTKGLSQPLLISRNLFREFVKVYFKEMDIIANCDLPRSMIQSSKSKLVAITPYVDDFFIDLLKSKAEEGLEISIISNRDTIESVRQQNVHNINLIETPHKIHEKYYVIDDICLKTSWNLQLTRSTNSFTIIWSKKSLSHIVELIRNTYKVSI